MAPGRFLEKYLGLFPPRGETKIIGKLAPLTHPATTLQQQEVLVMSQPDSTEKAPSTDKSTDETKSWVSLRRPGQAAPTREGTPAPGPAPAAQQVLQRGPLPRIFPPSLALVVERSVGPILFNIDWTFA